MNLSGKRIGFAMTGSYCTFEITLSSLEDLARTGAELTPILSYNAAKEDTRFMKAPDLKDRLRKICKKDIIETITGAEPIGPKQLLDLLIVAPCTGNSLAKIALGVTDTPVTMAVKAHLRNERPVLIAVCTNDALSANAKNLGQMLNTKDIYFVPFKQDDCVNKSKSLVADMSQILRAAEFALDCKQVQPLIN